MVSVNITHWLYLQILYSASASIALCSGIVQVYNSVITPCYLLFKVFIILIILFIQHTITIY